MKVAAIAALAATAAVASPVVVEHQARQGALFPTACTAQCSLFFPVYESCKAMGSQALWEVCIQSICTVESWNQLGSCLSCWGPATGQSTLPWYSLFMQACDDQF